MVTDPLGGRHDKLPRTGRVPTRGQSTDGPIVMGLTQHDDGMEHAWSPTRSTAGRRLRPISGTEAPPRPGPPWSFGRVGPGGLLAGCGSGVSTAVNRVVKD